MRTSDKTPTPEPSPAATTCQSGDPACGCSRPPATVWNAESSRSDSDAVDFGVILHCLRRLWWKILITGVFLALPVEFVVSRIIKEQFAATALIHFAAERIAPLGDSIRLSTDAYSGYKTTMVQLVKSRVFLKAVAARNEIASLPELQSATDPVTWLKGKLQVDFPDRGEVMQLTAKDSDPEQAVVVVNAAAEVFLAGAVDLDRERRATAVDAMEKMEQEIQQQLNQLRLELARVLQTREGASACAALRKQQVAMQTLAALDRELLQQELELRLASSKRNAADLLDEKVEASELEQRIEADPIASKLRQDLEQLRLAEARNRAIGTPAAVDQAKQRRQAVVGPIEERFNQRVAELSSRRRIRSEAAIRETESRVNIIAGQQKKLETLLPDIAQNSAAVIDLDRRKADIQRLERILDQLLGEKQRLKLRSGEVPRATLLDTPECPKIASNNTTRRAILGFAGVASFLLPALIAVVGGFRTGHVYVPSDVESELGLPVLGTLPEVPDRIIRRWDQPSRSHCHLRTQLKESVDVVLNTLDERLGGLAHRTILVCSAAREEGKTQFARHLAVNLAQHGNRTLVIDCDLRRPKLHRALRLPLDKGVSEVLRGELTAWEALQHSPVENLWVTTAGTWDERTRVAVNRGRVAELIEEYKPLFHTIIVLGAPVLAVVDSRLIAPRADGVILSVKRDVSRRAELAAANRLLEKLNKNLLGAAMTGGQPSAGRW